MTKDSNFKMLIPDPLSHRVYAVRLLPEAMVNTVYENLLTKYIPKLKNGSSLLPFYKAVCLQVLVNGRKFIDEIENDDSLEDYMKLEAYQRLYDVILNVYPVFHIFDLCNTANAKVQEEFKESLRRTREETAKAIKKSKEIPVKPKIKVETHDGVFTTKDVNYLRAWYSSKVIGQEEAINRLIDQDKLVMAGLEDRYCVLFVGPTGTGKSSCAQIHADERFEGKLVRINCNEYKNGHEYHKLIGSPPGFVGHTDQAGFLAQRAEKSDEWLFLFDEIEKAEPRFFDFIMNFVETGVITDGRGIELDFTRSSIIMTSNCGMSVLQNKSVGWRQQEMSQEALEDHIGKELKKTFAPEFLNRLSDIIYFKSLSYDQVQEIVELHLGEMGMEVNDDLMQKIIEDGHSVEYGARNILRSIRRHVLGPLADWKLDSAETMMPTDPHRYRIELNDGNYNIKKLEAYAI
jgi:ATP-dependent Clp protease ATP-binding subunit ClpA